MNRSIVNNAGDVIHQRESMTLKVLWEYVLLGGEKPWMTKTEKVDDGSRKYSTRLQRARGPFTIRQQR